MKTMSITKRGFSVDIDGDTVKQIVVEASKARRVSYTAKQLALRDGESVWQFTDALTKAVRTVIAEKYPGQEHTVDGEVMKSAPSVWSIDIYEDNMVASVSGIVDEKSPTNNYWTSRYFKLAYKRNEDGTFDVGEPVEVKSVTTYISLSAEEAPPKADTEQGKTEKSLIYCPLIMKNQAKRLVTGVVLEPEEVDGQGEIYGPDAIEEAEHEYMSALQTGAVAKDGHKVGMEVQHKEFDHELRVVESYLAPVDMDIPDEKSGETFRVKKGTWLMTAKVLDDEVWKRVEKGELNGFSIRGSVMYEDLEAAA